MSNLASNLTNMYVDLNQTLAVVANASAGNTMTIPKRIPIDSAEWFKTFGRQFMDSEVEIVSLLRPAPLKGAWHEVLFGQIWYKKKDLKKLELRG